MLIPFATTSYKSPSLPVSAQRAVNCYAEAEPKDAKTPVAVFGHPGIIEWTTCGSGPVRGQHDMGGVHYVVSGGFLYTVSTTGVATVIGGTISGTGPVSMADNGTQLVIVNGTNGYLYSTLLGFVLISDTDFNAANTVAFLNQSFYFDRKNTNQFFKSGILDGTSYDALQFAAAETDPDYVVAVAVNKQILLVFNQKTTEPWQDVGAANFPLQSVPGVVIDRGLAAPHAHAKQDNTTFFLGEDRGFYRLDGVTPVRVSTHAIEAEWQTYSTVADAFCLSYSWNGHKFVVVTFVAANKTWVFDVATSLWHERESWDINGRSLGRWRASCHLSLNNKEFIGDAYSGKIGYLSATTYVELGTTTQLLMTGTNINSDQKRVFIPRLEIDIEAGTGITTGQGSDPQAMLRVSRDGGRTWGTRQLWRAIGAIGAFTSRMRWLRLGAAREWVFELTISDPVKRVVIQAHADVKAGQ
jgi:hypothetical protein